MMRYTCDISPNLNVVVVDRDRDFANRLINILHIIGFNHIYFNNSTEQAKLLLEIEQADLAFVEIDDAYRTIWNYPLSGLRTLIIGMSYDRTGRDWIPAIRSGADTILLKQSYPHLLRATLSHLLESTAARKLKIVQFPNAHPSVEDNARGYEAPQRVRQVKRLIETLDHSLRLPRI